MEYERENPPLKLTCFRAAQNLVSEYIGPLHLLFINARNGERFPRVRFLVESAINGSLRDNQRGWRWEFRECGSGESADSGGERGSER